MTTASTRSAFDRELMSIRDDIVRMGSLVDKAVERAFAAFGTNDPSLAQSVINDDSVINDLRYKVEHDITSQVALQQPMAHDLRLLLACLIIANELERMGDHAEGISRTIVRDSRRTGVEVPVQLSDMAETVRQMLRAAMDAFVQEDEARAAEVAEMDTRVDNLYKDLFDYLVTMMGEGHLPIERGMYVLWAGHNLERIGDRVTNICERVIFTRSGRPARGLNPKPEDAA